MNFFKTLLATILGIFLSLGLILLILFITVSSSAQEPEPYVRDNSVLKIGLRGGLPAQTVADPLDMLFSQGNDKVSLETLKDNLTKARHQDNIKGVWLEIDYMGGSWANLQEAHRLISIFRDSSDKFIYASTNDLGYNEKGYFLATAADSVFSPPETFFEFDGFYSQVMFYDGMFEKLGVETEITRHGKYKGAVEPYYRKDMSEENEYQMTQLLNQVNMTFVTAVSQKTGRSVSELNAVMNGQPHMTSQFAYDEQLIDSLIYPSQIEEHINKRIGLEDEDSFKTISNQRYAKVSAASAGMEDDDSADDKIAVIYASGPIMPDLDNDSPFNDQQMITKTFFEKQLEEIRGDNDVKALVVRVNSPGGAGSTSDLIWKQLQNMKEKMPVIVSMGGVAASGGYYISMAADSIVAEPTTITGSIGVFSTKFNTKEFFNDKLGLTFDGVKTHEHADWLVQNRGLTPTEEKAFQQFVDNFYQAFIGKVAQSRNMDIDRVDELAQGRVWTGADAQENGLVDVLGGMDKALSIAADKAEISTYELEKYPKPKSFYELFMGSAAAEAKTLLDNNWFSSVTGMQEVQQQLSLLKQRFPLALFPFEITIE